MTRSLERTAAGRPVEDIVYTCKNDVGVYDGDLVLVLNSPLMMNGVDRNAKIVIDIEDKVTALAEKDTIQNRTACIMRSLKSLIGEISNYASCYHNKTPKTEKQKETYARYVDLLSITNGKAIDFAKTGVLYPVPRQIAKYGRPLPYFMKYASPYYKRMKRLSCAHSNMNKMCWVIEKWADGLRHKRSDGFDYTIMIDAEVGFSQEHFDAIEKIYFEFNKTVAELAETEHHCRYFDRFKDELEAEGVTKEFAANFEVDWQLYYNKFRARCAEICFDPKELANIAVMLCYQKYPRRSKKFMWVVAGTGIVENIQQVNICLPQLCDDGEYEYLGKRYALVPVGNELNIEPIEGGEG